MTVHDRTSNAPRAAAGADGDVSALDEPVAKPPPAVAEAAPSLPPPAAAASRAATSRRHWASGLPSTRMWVRSTKSRMSAMICAVAGVVEADIIDRAGPSILFGTHTRAPSSRRVPTRRGKAPRETDRTRARARHNSSVAAARRP